MTKKTKQFIIYARVSSEKQVKNTSLGSQIDVCAKYIQDTKDSLNYRLMADPRGDGTTPYIFADQESAFDPDGIFLNYLISGDYEGFFRLHRPALWDCINACISHGANLIVAWMDRLCRDTMIEKVIAKIFNVNGLEVVLADVSSEFEKDVKSLLAQEDNRQRRRKIIAGVKVCQERMKTTGLYANGRPAKYLDKEGKPRYGGPANFKGSNCAKAAAESSRKRAKERPQYKAIRYLLDLFSEQDLKRLQRRVNNLAACRMQEIPMSTLQYRGLRRDNDKPLTYDNMVCMANLHTPAIGATLVTKNKRMYTGSDFFFLIRRHIQEGDFVRVKIREGLFNGSNLKESLYVQDLNVEKKMTWAFLLKRKDFDALMQYGEEAFSGIISTQHLSREYQNSVDFLPPSARAKDVVESDILQTAETFLLRD